MIEAKDIVITEEEEYREIDGKQHKTGNLILRGSIQVHADYTIDREYRNNPNLRVDARNHIRVTLWMKFYKELYHEFPKMRYYALSNMMPLNQPDPREIFSEMQKLLDYRPILET